MEAVRDVPIGYSTFCKLWKRLVSYLVYSTFCKLWKRLVPYLVYSTFCKLWKRLVSYLVYSTFCKLWKRLVPYLVVTKPMTDLCWTCQQNSTALTRSVNTPLAEKSAALKAYLEHLEIVHKERSYYKTVCDQCRKSIPFKYTQPDKFTLRPPLLACNRESLLLRLRLVLKV